MMREQLAGALGISCVESYFLAWLGERTDVRRLYLTSHVPLTELTEDILVGGHTYESYGRIERLQNLAESLGMTGHRRITSLPRFNSSSGLYLLRVNDSFWEKYRRLPWRRDHYIAVTPCGSGYRYYNNYPLSEGTFTPEELAGIWDGAALLFSYRDLGESERERELAERVLEEAARPAASLAEIADTSGKRLCDALCLLKVTRLRLLALLQYLGEKQRLSLPCELTCRLRAHTESVNRLLTRVKLGEARGESDFGFALRALPELAHNENEIGRLIGSAGRGRK